MRYALISDIHGNLAALETVMEDVDKQSVDAIICLGDIVGYGPYPSECLKIVQERCPGLIVAGNHDMAAGGEGYKFLDINPDWFNIFDWTRNHLNAEQKAYLRALPLQFELDEFVAAHAKPAPYNRSIFEEKSKDWSRYNEYLRYGERGGLPVPTPHIKEVFVYASELHAEDHKKYAAVFGHTHAPFIYKPGGIMRSLPEGDKRTTITIQSEGEPMVVNVPSVGQPRDADWRTGYAILDEKGISLVRMAYDNLATVSALTREECPTRDLLRRFLIHGSNAL